MASIGHVAAGMALGGYERGAPLPVAPIGAGMLSPRGLYVVAVEFIAFLPFWAYALWPRRRATRES